MNKKELTQKLKDARELEAAGMPQKGWVLSNRKILMNQINPKVDIQNTKEFYAVIYYWRYFRQVVSQRVFKPMAISLVVIFLLVSYTVTVNVADASLPGDMLYPIKTTREKVKLVLTFKTKDKVKLQMDYVSRRVDELHSLVAQGGNNVAQIDNISSTAQKISDNVKFIKDNLNTITVASNSNEALEIVKDIDSKTLMVSHNLAEVKEALSLTVDMEVINDIDKAIDSTVDTGTAALAVIIDKFESGNADNITGDELTARVSERIKDTEDDIQSITNNNEMRLGVEMTSTDNIIDVNNIDNLATVSGTEASIETSVVSSTVSVIDNPGDIQANIEEAKNLLNQQDFGMAIEKLMQANSIVNILESDSGAVKGEFEEGKSNDALTTTNESVNNLK